MTRQYFDINPGDALYNLARAYPGGIEALAFRLGRSSNVLYKQLSPGVQTHHLSLEDFLRIIELCEGAGMRDAFSPLHAACFRLEHIAVKLPSATSSLGELFQDVLKMLGEEGALARSIEAATSEQGDGGSRVTSTELAEVELHIERSMASLAAIREHLRGKHRKDFPGLVAIQGGER